jgi:hypothetical protein
MNKNKYLIFKDELRSNYDGYDYRDIYYRSLFDGVAIELTNKEAELFNMSHDYVALRLLDAKEADLASKELVARQLQKIKEDEAKEEKEREKRTAAAAKRAETKRKRDLAKLEKLKKEYENE